MHCTIRSTGTRRRLPAVVGLLGILAAHGVAATPATANATPLPGVHGVDPGTAVASPSGLVPVYDAKQNRSRLVAPADAARILTEYWTSARIANAIPSDLPATPADSTTARRQPNGKPMTVTTPVAPPPTSTAAGIPVDFSPATGKVFFRFPSDSPTTSRSCSASSLGSPKRRLFLTAGHCVHSGKGGQWAENIAFMPGFHNGAGSAGVFPAFRAWSTTGWTNNSNQGFDYAFVSTQNNALGQRLVDRAGGHGLVVNPGRPFVTHVAYPDNFAGGQQQRGCRGYTSRRSPINRDMQLSGCDLRFGASGGPMLRDYASNGIGTAVSVHSYHLSYDDGVFGPYFDDATLSIYQRAENDSP